MRNIFLALATIVFSLVSSFSVTAQSWPFSGPFSGPSSFGSGPDRLTFGISTSLHDDDRTVAGFGGPEDIIIGNSFGLLLMATWLGGGHSTSSSVPILTYSLGLETENNGVDAFRQSGGGVFSTYGDSSFTGIFFGFGFETPLGGSYSSSSIAVPTFGAALNIGYGWAAVDGFGGSFEREGNGIYGRADAYLAIPVGSGVLLSPGVSYRAFDFGGIEDNSWSGFMRLTIPL